MHLSNSFAFQCSLHAFNRHLGEGQNPAFLPTHSSVSGAPAFAGVTVLVVKKIPQRPNFRRA
jgi:uncharacterized protein YcsI (UPF0317 family)